MQKAFDDAHPHGYEGGEAAVRAVEAIACELKAFCDGATVNLRAFVRWLEAAEKTLPLSKTGFYTDEARRLTKEIAGRLLSEHGVLMPRFQGMAADLLAFDGRLSEADALIDRLAEREDCPTDSLAQARKTLEQTARTCKALQAGMTRFCFRDLLELNTRIAKNVDFEGDGTGCNPSAVCRVCVDARRAAAELIDILLKVEFL